MLRDDKVPSRVREYHILGEFIFALLSKSKAYKTRRLLIFSPRQDHPDISEMSLSFHLFYRLSFSHPHYFVRMRARRGGIYHFFSYFLAFNNILRAVILNK